MTRIQSATERAIRMVADLLDFTRVRLGGGIQVTPRPLDLHELTRRVVEEVQMSRTDGNLRLQREGDGRGHWDADRLAQVITNLVSNAVRYGTPGAPVTVSTRGEDDSVVLSVHNVGPTISPEQLLTLFEPLQRGAGHGENAARSIGLGLFIVKHLVEAHHGTVDVRSTESEGTTFTVRLPRQG